MGKDKNQTKSGLLNFKGLRIEERLRKAFNMIIVIASIGTVVGIVALVVVIGQFKHSMQNYALPQGDIALFMNEYAECRSNMRGIIGYEDQELIDTLLEKHKTRKANAYDRLAAIEETIVTNDGRKAYDKIETALEAYFKKEAEVIELGATTDQELCRQAQEMAISEITPLYEALDNATLELMEINIEKEHQMEGFTTILETGAMILMVALLIGASVAAKRIAYVISNGIAKPLAELEDRVVAFSEGDINGIFPTSKEKDEIAGLMNASHTMADTLQKIIADISGGCSAMADGNFAVESENAHLYVGDLRGLYESINNMRDNVKSALVEVEELATQVNVGASNLAEAAQDLAEGATDQAASVQEMLATMNTVSDGLKETATSVEEAYKQALKCADDAQNSREEMGNMVNSMNRISETSKKIENIIAEIESIASQTNLLSLNASIEAARAGEAGRGFAVVADEIRNLADQSAKSAVDTRELVSNTLYEIEQGSKIAFKTADVLDGVVNAIQKIAETNNVLSENSKEQAYAVEQADIGITRISEVVQSNSAAAEESSATSQELSAQAMSMHELVSRFTLN